MTFSRAKRLLFLEANGKSKATLYSGVHKDRHRYLQWLYQARKWYGLTAGDSEGGMSSGRELLTIRLFSTLKTAIYAPKTPIYGTLKLNNQGLIVARPPRIDRIRDLGIIH